MVQARWTTCIKSFTCVRKLGAHKNRRLLKSTPTKQLSRRKAKNEHESETQHSKKHTDKTKKFQSRKQKTETKILSFFLFVRGGQTSSRNVPGTGSSVYDQKKVNITRCLEGVGFSVRRTPVAFSSPAWFFLLSAACKLTLPPSPSAVLSASACVSAQNTPHAAALAKT